MSQLVLRARGLGREVRSRKQRRTLLANIDLSLQAGTWTVVCGPSGAGKSSLLHILGALEPDFVGSLELMGTQLAGAGPSRLAAVRARHCGFIFQRLNLLPHLSALENVLLPSLFSPAPRDPSRGRALLERLGLGHAAGERPSRLSGGEQQRVAVARAAYGAPHLLICDEPTASLDPASAALVLQLCQELCAGGCTLLMATHDSAAMAGAHRRLQLAEGAPCV